jgi:tRNA A-37 threonylcarbamoyl transferase component Bud32
VRKPVFFTGWLRTSRLLLDAEFEGMMAGAEVLEQDAHGIKVVRLPNGDILKTFRVKHLISSARIYSHARSFCRNADRLQVLGIPTVTIRQLFHFADSGRSAVLYQPLPGNTLRQIAGSGNLQDALLEQLGIFVAGLHRSGIYFRSLHLGNIVQTHAGKLGLIDIADMSIMPWRLSCGQRLRNFRHMCRLAEDRRQFGRRGWKQLGEAYEHKAGLGSLCVRYFTDRFDDLFR